MTVAMTYSQLKVAVRDIVEALEVWEKSYRVTLGITADTFEPTGNAPQTKEGVSEAFKAAQRHSMPVFDGGCDKTIFSLAHDKDREGEYNQLFRLQHDFCHHFFDCDFSYDGEISTFMAQSLVIGRAIRGFKGFISQSRINRARTLLRCEIVGQAEYYRDTGNFVDDQLQFTLDYLGVTE